MKKAQYIMAMLLLCSICSNAQERERFDALKYSMQKRHRSNDAEFVNQRIFDNTYFTLQGGLEKITPKNNYSYDPGTNIGIAIGKEFTKRTAIQFSIGFKSFIDKSNTHIDASEYNPRMNQKMTHTSFSLDHIYNMSAFMWGYNPYRLIDVATVAGVGYSISKEKYSKYDLKNYIFDAHLGLQARIRTRSAFEFVIEPRITAYNDAVDFSSNANWNKFDIAFGGNIGLRYNLRHKGFTQKNGMPETITDGLFFDLSTGIATQNASKFEYSGGKISPVSYGSFATMTPAVNIGIGKWLTKGFGLRLAAEKYSVLWHGISFDGYANNSGIYDIVNYRTVYHNHTRYETTRYTSLGLEFVLSPQRWFMKDAPQVEAELLVGGRIGKMDKMNFVKATNSQEIDDKFNGISAAIRLKSRIAPGFSIFIEPRYNISYYQVKGELTNISAKRETYSDKQYMALFGVEIENCIGDKRANDKFRPHPYVSLAGGMNISMQDTRYSNKRIMDVVYSGTAGYALTKLSSFQLNVENKQVAREIIFNNADQYTSNKYAMLSIGADYRLNIGNLIAGYDSQRKVNFELYAGPNINLHSGEMKYDVPYIDKDNQTQYEEFSENVQKASIGYELGGIISYKLTPHIDLNLNIKLHKYNGDVINKDIEKDTEDFEKKYRYIVSGATKVDRVVNYQLGVTYNF